MTRGERGAEGSEKLGGEGGRAGTLSAPGAGERDGLCEAETALGGETEVDPYDVAEEIFRFRAKQLQAVGKLPQDAYKNEEEFSVYAQQLTELHREIHEGLGLLWPPPWVEEV